MEVKADLTVDLVAIYMRGTDAFGKKFDVALDHEAARRLLFKLHRMILEQDKMRRAVNSSRDGGKVA